MKVLDETWEFQLYVSLLYSISLMKILKRLNSIIQGQIKMKIY